MISPYLDVIIEPMHRAMIEAAGAKITWGPKILFGGRACKEVLSMLEERCDADYLPALAKVKVKARRDVTKGRTILRQKRFPTLPRLRKRRLRNRSLRRNAANGECKATAVIEAPQQRDSTFRICAENTFVFEQLIIQ
ncbi:hypothetical protein MHU86_10647 [Fragilaria crotonensis]|nr:hypothetical protein MHU86_10647 [Fragilaria crotonensis]